MNSGKLHSGGDAMDWFVRQGDGLKIPMIENTAALTEEERQRMELMFDWAEAYLSHDGFEQTMDRLETRGLSREDATYLLGYVIEEHLPREQQNLEDIDEVTDLPEKRQAMLLLEDLLEDGGQL